MFLVPVVDVIVLEVVRIEQVPEHLTEVLVVGLFFVLQVPAILQEAAEFLRISFTEHFWGDRLFHITYLIIITAITSQPLNLWVVPPR